MVCQPHGVVPIKEPIPKTPFRFYPGPLTHWCHVQEPKLFLQAWPLGFSMKLFVLLEDSCR